MKENFGLQAQAFEQLVSDLRRNETAFFERVFLVHFEECVQYLKREYGATQDDAYDTTMDTLLEFRRRLVEGKLSYGNLRYLFTRMATQHYVRSQKSFKSQEIQESDMKEENTASKKEELALLDQAWNELGTDCQRLLKWVYYGKMKLSEIAEQEEKTAASIRKQKERCIKKLKALLNQKQTIPKQIIK